MNVYSYCQHVVQAQGWFQRRRTFRCALDMVQAKPTAATYALQTPEAVSQFLSQLVAWGRTSANDWQSCGGCNGWEIDRSPLAPNQSTANDASGAAPSARANGNSSCHDSYAESSCSQNGRQPAAHQVQDAQNALRQQLKLQDGNVPENFGEKSWHRSSEGQRRRSDWKWDQPLDTWYEAGPPKSKQASPSPPPNDR